VLYYIEYLAFYFEKAARWLLTKQTLFHNSNTTALLNWRTQFPSSLDQFELWNASVISKLQQLYDKENYQIVVLCNKGGIQGAFTGKRAATAKALVDWLADEAVERPILAVFSTKKKSGYHKPAAKLWNVAETMCNGKTKFDIAHSFYVGDSVAVGDAEGSDEQFAKNVGDAAGGTPPTFYTPQGFFGPSNISLRERALPPVEDIPQAVLETRAALTCGYLRGPILLVLCGAQGSGKSTFCNNLLGLGGGGSGESHSNWVHLSQDTIRNGKPGKREAVEQAALEALAAQKCVVIDRMHLDEKQREYFVKVAQTAGVPAHAVVLTVSKEVVAQRVRDRENHPVTGESGAKMAVESTKRLVVPTYNEGFALISASGTPEGAKHIAGLYRAVTAAGGGAVGTVPAVFPLASSDPKKSVEMPSIVLGTMGLGRKTAEGIVNQAALLGFKGFDTAPTYKNEDKLGAAGLTDKEAFVIVKVPKRAGTAEMVRSELSTSLSNLNIDKCNLLLLHWPSDEATLKEVWKEMETCVADGLAVAIGVCNFNVDALRVLLSFCTIPPAINQVERHPLLPQWELVEFCSNHDILLQAHSPIGQGKEDLLGHATVTKIAGETEKSAAQVVLAWNLQQGVAVVPKCSSEEHMQEVLASGSVGLSTEQLKALNEISETKRFVAPPFMYGPAPFCWGKTMPK